MKIALIHDYLREYGGAERVLEAMHEIWPKAPLFTSFVSWENLGNQGYRFRNWDIRTSPIADNWLIRKFHSPLRFLAPVIWNSLDLSGYDVVISSSGWFMCRGVANRQQTTDNRQQKKQFHICYIHHPPRNLYGYATGSSLQKYWPVRVYATIVNFFLRHYDFETAQKVDYFVANSEETKRRVCKFYRRESTVIYPPVEIPSAKHKALSVKKKKDYFLSVGRLTYSKRVDLAIMAANKLKIPLKVVGTGAEETYLRSLAGPMVEFPGSVSDSELAELYLGAKALIFCSLDEDFGMVPVESMVHGVPVIALGQGGVLETIVHKKTGVLFNEPTVDALVKAIKQCNNMSIRSSFCIAQAQKFSKERFKKELKDFVEEKIRHAGAS